MCVIQLGLKVIDTPEATKSAADDVFTAGKSLKRLIINSEESQKEITDPLTLFLFGLFVHILISVLQLLAGFFGKSEVSTDHFPST